MKKTKLSFTLNCTPTTRGRMLVCAIGADGEAVTSESYSPGDGARRRKVAGLWAKDDRLRNGKALAPETITRALEAAEVKYLDEQAAAALAEEEATKADTGDAITTAVELPFTIDCAMVSRNKIQVVAIDTDGEAITSEVHTVGDGDKRRKIARLWADDDRLCSGEVLDAKAIARALEAAEIECSEREQDDTEGEGEHAEPVQAASYVDRHIIAELVWNIEEARADFVVFDRDTKTAKRVNIVEADVPIVPPSCADIMSTPGGNIPGSVLVPTFVDKGGENEDALREDVRRFIDSFVELPEHGLTIAVEYVFLSWVHDSFDELPYLAFRTSDFGRGKSRALETVGAVCYRAFFCGGGSTAAATLRMLDLFGGTMVADEFDQDGKTELGQAICQILNQGFQKRRPIIKCVGDNNEPCAFQCFGPKLLALRGRLGDDATESRTISIHMEQRTRSDIPINLPRGRFDQEVLALRNRLLWWRFTRLREISIDPALADAGLQDRGNQIGLPLLSVARTAEARAAIIAALKDQQVDTAADRADSLAGEVFRVVLAMTGGGDFIRPRDVASKVNAERATAAGIEVEKLGGRALTPERTSKVMRVDLELSRAGKDRRGAYYDLPDDRLAQLCERFGEDAPKGARVNPLGAAPSTVTTVTPSPSQPETPKSGLFDSASGACDGGDGGDGTTGRPPTDSQTVTESAPDDDPDDEWGAA